jgi:predicted RecA/RadA family phage recombinase
MDNFKQHGDRILHTLTADAVSGDPLVVGTGLLGVAMNNGANTEVIDTAVEGVYRLPKVSAGVILRGEQVLWDDSADEVDDDAATPATGDFLCGYAWEDAGAGVLFVDVKINRGAPTVT